MIVVGIDPSLTGTGIAIFGDGEPRVLTVGSKAPKDATLQQRSSRIEDLAGRIVSLVPIGASVAIETPAHNQTSGHHHDRSGLWWMLVSELIRRNPVTEVSVTQVKKYATGKGNASKSEVMAKMIRRHLDLEIANDNEGDAVALATLLARALGEPIEDSMPQPSLDVAASLRPSMGQS